MNSKFWLTVLPLSLIAPSPVHAAVELGAKSQDVSTAPIKSSSPSLLQAEDFRHYFDTFNQNDQELYAGVETIKNDQAWTS
jgi:hypothetical protein